MVAARLHFATAFHTIGLVNAGKAPTSSPIRTLGWAAYLATSWTWCIGMFLPILLMRDFGPGAWWVFAIPNVIGAAAMGFVLSRQGHSEQLVQAHRPAMRVFSLVTIVFQATFFLLVVFPLVHTANARLAYAPLGIALIAGMFTRGWGALVATVLTTLGVIIAWFALITVPAAAPAPLFPVAELAYLAPVCTFGFLLCPYLDLTFHEARQATTPRSARVAFGLGFGVIFLIAIAFTPFYGSVFASGTFRADPIGLAALLIAMHLATQLVFTINVHATAALKRRADDSITVLIVLGMAIVFSGLNVVFPVGDPPNPGPDRMIWYRMFMSAYGMVFPAYVWLCMIPRGTGPSRAPTLRHWMVLAGACLAASPFYWFGFMDGRWVMLAPGLGIILLARLFVPRSRGSTESGNPPPSGAPVPIPPDPAPSLSVSLEEPR